MQTTISRVFMNGNSQAVRIPQKFRFDASQVEIHRNADGDLVLHPVGGRFTSGAERSTRKSDVSRRLGDLTRSIPVRYGASTAMCEHYAVQFTKTRAAGTPIGANDLWIACHALADNCTLVTNNTGEFARVQTLRLDNWAE